MPSNITRRDFLNGAALTIAAGLAPVGQLRAFGASGYPPALTGLRGSTDAAYQTIHALARDGEAFPIDGLAATESFDLVVVGAGIAGLTAAWDWRRRHPKASILILDNHDDFGGHARRCEFEVGGRLLLGYGGSESMAAPRTEYKGKIAAVIKALGIAPERFYREDVFHRTLYPRLGLSRATFFDRETFGVDKLVTGDPIILGFDEFAPANPNARGIDAFLKDCPLTDEARRGLTTLFRGTRDYLAGTSTEAKVGILEKVSYRHFLENIAKLPKEAADFFQNRSSDNFGLGVDAIPATDAMSDGFPGAKGLKIEKELAGEEGHNDEPYVHHFPDGNATMARALVRSLIPAVATGRTIDDLITAKFDYSKLDVAGAKTRLRLNATVVVAKNEGGKVSLGYVHDGALHRIEAARCIVATYGVVMARICPEVGEAARGLLLQNVKSPLVYTKVWLRNWNAFMRLGVHKINGPTSFHSIVKLDYPVSLGKYKFPRTPPEPMGIHLVHVPLAPNQGHDARTQCRLGRMKLIEMPFAAMEEAIRSDLDRMLAGGGFSSGRDILGITVNRWSHGYAYAPSTLYDDTEAIEKGTPGMRAKIGNIAFANSDTAWDAYAHSAMREALRAVGELA